MDYPEKERPSRIRGLNRKETLMETKSSGSQAVDAYIANFPEDVQARLTQVRSTIHEAAPDAAEDIKYGLPTFILHGNLVHYGAFQHHIGFYPAPLGLEAFQAELSQYSGAKGSVQFPYERPIPYDLIRRIVLFRVQANQEKAAAKGKKK